jgi:hypothetical protein
MSFYSYKNCNTALCPGVIAGDCLTGLNEKVCVQVKKVYDSCLQQTQLDAYKITITDAAFLCPCEDGATPVFCAPMQFESCRSAGITGEIRNLTIDRLCDRPNFARVRADIDIPVDILCTDANCRECIARGVVTVHRDVLLFIPEESIIPFTIETLVSAICVSGNYIGNDQFEVTICVTIILKVLAEVEILVPSYGFCPIPPCEEFAENVCDEFFSLPIYPQVPVESCDTAGSNCYCGPVTGTALGTSTTPIITNCTNLCR